MRRNWITLSSVVVLLLLAATSIAHGEKALNDHIFGEGWSFHTTSARPPPAPPVGSQASCEQGQHCVQKYLCSNDSTSGDALIDIRYSEKNPCVDYLLQCCPEDHILPNITRPPPPPTQLPFGLRNPDGIGFRITGNSDGESEYGEFPWTVAVLEEKQVSTTGKTAHVYQCGGSLIHTCYVLTTAHCVYNKPPGQLVVRAGEWDFQTKNEIFPHQDRKVTEIAVHPEYHNRQLYNNIALLFLDLAVKPREGLQHIFLPPPEANFNTHDCFVSGWKKQMFDEEAIPYQAIMRKTKVAVVPADQCETTLRTTRLGRRFNLHSSYICAAAVDPEEVDACNVGEGSPLVCSITKGTTVRYYQVGVSAWGVSCGRTGIPTVYTSTVKFLDWIHQKTERFHIDPFDRY